MYCDFIETRRDCLLWWSLQSLAWLLPTRPSTINMPTSSIKPARNMALQVIVLGLDVVALFLQPQFSTQALRGIITALIALQMRQTSWYLPCVVLILVLMPSGSLLWHATVCPQQWQEHIPNALPPSTTTSSNPHSMIWSSDSPKLASIHGLLHQNLVQSICSEPRDIPILLLFYAHVVIAVWFWLWRMTVANPWWRWVVVVVVVVVKNN